jgi:hypothetical protein
VRRAPRAGGAGGRRIVASAAGLAIAAVLCAAAIAGIGCGAATAPQAAMTSGAAGVTGRLSLSPAPAPVMKPLLISVELVDESGQPIADRAVTFDLSMPSMAMAPNRPEVAAAGDGVYTATTLLSMAGGWRLDVAVGSPGRSETVSFTFSAR